MTGATLAVGALAAGALALAVTLHAAVFCVARSAGRRWPAAHVAVVIALGSMLSVQALWRARWLPLAGTAALLLAAAAALARRGVRRPSTELPKLGTAGWLAVAFVAADAVYAAFPDYRYDQWNYHLIVAKAVSTGPLAPPILNDHVYFAGSYEYLLTIPRSLSSDDVFNQCFADAFTWLLLAVVAYGVVVELRRTLLPALPAPLLVLAAVMFGLPDQQALMSPKPDTVLLAVTLALIALAATRVVDSADETRRHRWLDAGLAGFLCTASLGLKVTWLHALPALAVAAALLRVFVPFSALLAGLVAGLASAFPVLAKNALLFGNALHPAQAGPFRSTLWNHQMADYWHDVNGPAASVAAYVRGLSALPARLAYELLPLTLPALVVAGLAVWSLRHARERSAVARLPPAALRVLLATAAMLAAYLLLWPVFYGPWIYTRFVFPGVAGLLVGALAALAWGLQTIAARGSSLAMRLAPLALLLPAVFWGDLGAKARFVTRWAAAPPAQLLTSAGPPEWQLVRDLPRVNADRRARRPGVAFVDDTAIVDFEATYLLDAAAVSVGSPVYEWHRDSLGRDCLPALFERLRTRYLVTRADFRWWPEPYPRLAAALPAIDPAGRVRRLEATAVDRMRREDPGCR